MRRVNKLSQVNKYLVLIKNDIGLFKILILQSELWLIKNRYLNHLMT